MELPLPAAGSKRREVVLAGGAVLLVGALVYFWRRRQPTDGSNTSVAADTGAAGYTYPLPAGGAAGQSFDTGSSADYNSLFTQNQEILRLLDGSAGTGTTGTPDAPKPAPGPVLSAVGYGPDPERPGTSAWLNAQGYLDLGDPRNYASGPVLAPLPAPVVSSGPSQVAPAPTFANNPPPAVQSAVGYGPDPERPGTSAWLNAQGYLDLGDPRNYASGPVLSAPTKAAA